MKEKLELTVEDIYNKEFSIDFKGYAAEEIDKYLDIIIQDYQKMEHIIKNYEEQISQLKYKAASLEANNLELEAQLKVVEDAPAPTNLDILKRLARLEEIVLQNK